MLLIGLCFYFEYVLLAGKFKLKYKKVGNLPFIVLLAILLVFSSSKEPSIKYPKSTTISTAVTKAHQEYPYVLQYDQLENGFWGAIF